MKNPILTRDLLEKRLIDLTVFECVVDAAIQEAMTATRQ